MAGSIIELHTEVPADQEANVFGQFDEHLKLIERTLNVTVISRDGILKIMGNEQSAVSAKKLIEELVVLAKRGNIITKQNVNYCPCCIQHSQTGRSQPSHRHLWSLPDIMQPEYLLPGSYLRCGHRHQVHR